MNTLRTTTFAAVLVLSAVLFASFLQSKDCENGSGAPEKKTMDIGELHGIVLQGPMEVKLHRAASQTVTVEAQPNLIGLLGTKVSNGVWTINTTKCYTSDKPFTVHIGVPVIDRVSVLGSGNVTGTDVFETGALDLSIQGSGDIRMAVKAGTVDTKVQGSGNVVLTGDCQELAASVAGSGDIRAGELRTVNAKAVVVGSGDVIVRVSGTLTAAITGSGDVKYHGEPARIERQTAGSGTVKAAR